MTSPFRRESITNFIDTFTVRPSAQDEYKTDNNQYNSRKGSTTNSSVIGNNNKDQQLDNQIKNLSLELKYAKLDLDNERGRVQELQHTISTVKNNKFQQESNIVEQLQNSQNLLRSDLSAAIQSKVELCFKTSNEIDRLRKIILMGKNGTRVNVNNMGFRDLDNDLNSRSSNNNEISSIPDDEKHNTQNNNNSNNNNNNIENSQEQQSNTNNDNSIQNELNHNKHRKSLSNKGSLYKEYKLARKFPHGDRSRIDLLILENGDGQTYANPFGAVNLQYTGYIVNDNPYIINNWQKFTTDEIDNTVYETNLGKNENIFGLEQAVLSLTVGAKALVWVPYRLAWGEHGTGDLIPERCDVIFELKLVSAVTENNMNLNIGDEFDDTMSGNVDMSTLATSSLGINDMGDNFNDGLSSQDALTMPTTITDDQLFANEQYDTNSGVMMSESPYGGHAYQENDENDEPL